ncbi:MAG: hypothetical protein MJE77_37140 [Proteobacteria bacterium]|nr:hypothetical protein [Pseudomonadota bacterium]
MEHAIDVGECADAVTVESIQAHARWRSEIERGLVMDTKKHYFRVLAQKREEERQRGRLILDTYPFRDIHVDPSSMLGTVSRTLDGLTFARAVLRIAPLAALDMDLLTVTDIDDLSIRVYMEACHLTTGDDERDRRERDRLAQASARPRAVARILGCSGCLLSSSLAQEALYIM